MQFTDLCHHVTVGFPWWSNGKEFICKEGDPSLIPNQKNTLEKGMTTHFSILAWTTPWTEDPGRLQSVWLQKVGHD